MYILVGCEEEKWIWWWDARRRNRDGGAINREETEMVVE